MGKQHAKNPVRERWVIDHIAEWDATHPDMRNTISGINEAVGKFKCDVFPKCLETDVNRCYVRGKMCLNITRA